MAKIALYEDPAARRRRWLWPSLGLLLFALTLAGMLGADAHFLTDPATARHLAAGKLAWTIGSVLAADPFTYTVETQFWMQHQWLFDLAFGGVELVGGVALAYALGGVLFALIPLALWRLLIGRGVATPWPVAFAYLCFAVVLLHAHWLLRPQLINYVLLPVFLAVWYRYPRGLPPWGWLLLPVLLIGWANIHGGFVTALLFWGLAWTGRLIDNALAGQRRVLDDPALRWALFGAVAGAVTLLNPYGWHLHRMIWRMVFELKSYAFYLEYQPPDFASGDALAVGYLIIVGLLVVGRFLPGRSPLGWESVLPLVVFAYFATQSQRHVLLLLFVAAVPICRDWGGAFRRLVKGEAGRRVAALSRFERESRSYLWQVPTLAVLVGAVFLVTPGAAALRVGDANVSARAVAYLQANVECFQRPLTTTWNGGPLAYHLGPDLKISFDDRNEFHGDIRLYLLRHLLGARSGWRHHLESGDYDSAILEPGWPLARELNRSPRWRGVYQDDTALIFLFRPTSSKSPPTQ